VLGLLQHIYKCIKLSRGTTEAEYRTIEDQFNVYTGNVERRN
jgi:hypothetical protein